MGRVDHDAEPWAPAPTGVPIIGPRVLGEARRGVCAGGGLITIGSPLGIDEVQDRLQPGWSGDDGFPHEKVERGWVKVLASAAPGSDIICHEVCKELGIESTVCLPMPKDLFSQVVFADLDAWRTRFLGLVDGPAARPLAPSPTTCYQPEGLPS